MNKFCEEYEEQFKFTAVHVVVKTEFEQEYFILFVFGTTHLTTNKIQVVTFFFWLKNECYFLFLFFFFT